MSVHGKSSTWGLFEQRRLSFRSAPPKHLSVDDYPSFAEGSENDCALSFASLQTAPLLLAEPGPSPSRIESTVVSLRAVQQRATKRRIARDFEVPKRASESLAEPSKYQLTRTLGEGGTSVVHEAFHRTTRKWVAIKRLRPAACLEPAIVERFLGEANAIGRIDHPAMVEIHETGLDEAGFPYLVMEYLEGETLAQRLLRGRVSHEEFLGIAGQIVDALRAVHKAGVIHCDLKPENVFLLSEAPGRIKLLDFGAASLGAECNESFQPRGTPLYMAPEQLTSSMVEAASDVYSLGCLFYRMLAGTTPFRGTVTDILHAHCFRGAIPLRSLASDVAPAIENLIAEMTKKSPHDRPTARAMACRLKLIDAGFHGSDEDAIATKSRAGLLPALATIAVSASLFSGLMRFLL